MRSPSSAAKCLTFGAANGFGFVAGAVIGAFLLKRHLGSLGGRAVMLTTGWTIAASAVGLIVAGSVNWAVSLALPSHASSFITLAHMAICGIAFLIATGVVLSRSGLPEVINLGRALQRIPGMARFIKVEADAGIQVEAPAVAEIRPLYTLEVDPQENGWASFAIVNVGGLWELKFSIDEHPLYVYGTRARYLQSVKSDLPSQPWTASMSTQRSPSTQSVYVA